MGRLERKGHGGERKREISGQWREGEERGRERCEGCVCGILTEYLRNIISIFLALFSILLDFQANSI